MKTQSVDCRKALACFLGVHHDDLPEPADDQCFGYRGNLYFVVGSEKESPPSDLKFMHVGTQDGCKILQALQVA